MTIQTTIRSAMTTQQISQRKLAALVGCRHATICDFLNGKHNLRSDILEKVIKQLNLNLQQQ